MMGDTYFGRTAAGETRSSAIGQVSPRSFKALAYLLTVGYRSCEPCEKKLKNDIKMMPKLQMRWSDKIPADLDKSDVTHIQRGQ